MMPGTATLRRQAFFFALALIVVMSLESPAPQELTALVVEEVVADSAAARAGLMVEDRIVSYNGRPLRSPEALQALEENTFKQQVELQVRRGGTTFTLAAQGGRLGLRVRPMLSSSVATAYEEARVLAAAQNVDAAIARWIDAAREAQAAGDSATGAWLFARVGEARESRRQWREGSEAYTAAWKLLQATDDRAAQSRVLSALARCSQSLNDLPAALEWFDRAAVVDFAAGYAMWAAGARNSMGIIAYSQGDLVRAEDYFSLALSIRTRLTPDSADVAASLNNLGNVANERGNHTAARDYHHRSLAIKERVAPDSLTVAISLTNLGNLAQTLGDLPVAEDYHARALAIKERLAPNSLSLAISLNSLGNVAQSRDDLPSAHDYYSRALAIRERLAPSSLDVSSSLSNLGEVAHGRGDVAAAEDYHTRALDIRERLAPNSLDVAGSLNNLGSLARNRGDLATAQSLHVRALALQERLAPDSLTVAISLDSLGSIARDRGDPDTAFAYDLRAFGMRDRLAPNSLFLAATLDRLGGMALTQRRLSDALALFTRALDIIEAQRWEIDSAEARALLFAQHTKPYTGLLRTHLALNDVPAAFATAERARARSLLELLTEARADIRQGVEPALLARERTLQQQLNAKAAWQTRILSAPHAEEQARAIEQELQGLLTQYRQVHREIRNTSPRYAALTQPQPLGLTEIRRELLDQQTVLLEYVLGEDASHLFFVTQTSIERFALPPRAEIERASRRIYDLLMERQTVRGETAAARRLRVERADAEYQQAASTLSQMVLGPVARQLLDRRLLVVADGALQYVPFAALPTPSIDATTTEQGLPLMVDHEIVSLPSASVAVMLRRDLQGRRPAERMVAVVADPVFDAGDPRLRGARQATADRPVAPLPADAARAMRSAGLTDERGAMTRLPFTRDEADAILALAPAGQGTRAVDFDASRATVTSPALSRYRIVHLATHGIINTEDPELSGLVLSLVDRQGAQQDGFLRLHEVYNLNWSADLVVLSACQTALGKEINGEGLVGLTRGFMYAGSPRVMASLWNVNDSVTAQLMKRFYEGMFAKGLSPAAALRAAQVAMWKQRQWHAPYYWAAFVIQGEWR